MDLHTRLPLRHHGTILAKWSETDFKDYCVRRNALRV